MPTPSPAPRAQPTGLPIEGVISQVREALAGPGTAVLEAEPGAGKTTVVPLRLLDEPWLATGRIVMLEPRRLAARAAAARMAHLLGDRVGNVVGYRTRDDAKVSRSTRIEVVTEGILTRRVQGDPGLEGTSLVIFDEFHERSLAADLGLALTLEARALLRPDLRVMVMSATLNVGDVANLLGASGPAAAAGSPVPAPVISAPGRTHPVAVRWRPRQRRDRLEAVTTSAIETALSESSGDVLVFLPGMGEIKRTAQALDRSGALGLAAVDVHLLHGSLPADAQDSAVAPAPAGRRKVVLSTDLAETSLTVEGVTAVVDSGLARVPRFDAGVGMTRLSTVSSSQASAEQRAGRAGRVQPGIAYRLWSKSEHSTRPRHIQPEITQVELAGLALELAAWGAADPATLSLLDQPPRRTWEEARTLLGLLGAIDADGRITSTGKAMVRLPLHPRLARMVVAAADGADGPLACVVAALLEERDVFGGRPDERSTSLAERVGLIIDRRRHHPQADGRALTTVRRRADELMRRAGIGGAMNATDVPIDSLDRLGSLLLVGYPDRLGRARSTGGGRWRLRSGSGVSTDGSDSLNAAAFIVVADTDGQRRDARIRVATPIDVDEIADALADQVTRRTYLRWDRTRNDLTERVERAIDTLELDFTESRPAPGPDTVTALIDRVREVGPSAVLGRWNQADGLRARVAFLRDRLGDAWPDWSEAALTASLEEWLAPMLGQATGRSHLEAVDVAGALALTLGWDSQMELARLAPKTVTVPSGRELTVNYQADPPALAVRLGEMFGSTVTPSVLDGALPLRLELLNPAGRPVQVTSDLAGFWDGTWAEVRRELRGRYPKHDWPEHPGIAKPRRR
jgi:ATP-dependent helicase HrpB